MLPLAVQARCPVRAHRRAQPAIGLSDGHDVDRDDRVGAQEPTAEEWPAFRLVREVLDDLAGVLASLLRFAERADGHALAVRKTQRDLVGQRRGQLLLALRLRL